MKSALLLCFVAAVAALSAEDVLRSFSDFKYTFNRQYASKSEENQRFDCFVKNLAKIEELNSRDTALHGINRFTDLCADEFKQLYHNQKITNASTVAPGPSFPESFLKSIPTSIDWRTKGAVVGIKDQAACGSCWAFSAVAAMEAAWFLAGNTLVSLSEEELVQCATNGNYGCQGGLMDNAINWVIQHGGINSEAAYPYTSGGGVTGSCDTQKSSVSVAHFSALIKAPQDESQIAGYVAQYGPLFIAVDAMDGWQTYRSGVKSTCSGRQLDHGVDIVGFAPNYWIVRNSWGLSWGENGYIRLARGVNCDGLTSDVGTAKV